MPRQKPESVLRSDAGAKYSGTWSNGPCWKEIGGNRWLRHSKWRLSIRIARKARERWREKPSLQPVAWPRQSEKGSARFSTRRIESKISTCRNTASRSRCDPRQKQPKAKSPTKRQSQQPGRNAQESACFIYASSFSKRSGKLCICSCPAIQFPFSKPLDDTARGLCRELGARHPCVDMRSLGT
jgi:hypothetical protein